MQTKVFADTIFRQLFTNDEFVDLAGRFRKEYLGDIATLLSDLRVRFSSDNEVGLYEDFKDNTEKAEPFFFPYGKTTDLELFYAELDAHIESLGDDEPASASSWSEQAAKAAELSATSATEDVGTIFDDVDD